MIKTREFKHTNIYKFTQVKENRTEKSIIDYFLVRKHKAGVILHVKVTKEAEIRCDHLIKMCMKEKEKRVEKKYLRKKK